MEEQEIQVERRAQELAQSGEFDGFHAMLSTLQKEFDEATVDRLVNKREVRWRVSDLARGAWKRKQGQRPW